MEMDKLDARFAGDLESSAHLYTYDLDPEALRKFGYDGPHLVVSGIDRANEFNFTQDAEVSSTPASGSTRSFELVS